MATTTVYLTVEPTWGRYSYNRDQLQNISVTRVTKKRPPRSAGPVVKLTLSIPDAAFHPLQPEVTIDVPPDALDFEPTVTVDFPEADGG